MSPEARKHAVELEQCALVVDSAPLARAMTEAAKFLRASARPLDDIAAERRRQIEVEGWTPEHDDGHDADQLALAAAAYATPARERVQALRGGAKVYGIGSASLRTMLWPFDGLPSPRERRRELIIAAALLLAEIERLDRAKSDARP